MKEKLCMHKHIIYQKCNIWLQKMNTHKKENLIIDYEMYLSNGLLHSQKQGVFSQIENQYPAKENSS